MTEVSISLHADSRPDFITSDSATVAKMRAGLGSEAIHLVPAPTSPSCSAVPVEGHGRPPSIVRKMLTW